MYVFCTICARSITGLNMCIEMKEHRLIIVKVILEDSCVLHSFTVLCSVAIRHGSQLLILPFCLFQCISHQLTRQNNKSFWQSDRVVMSRNWRCWTRTNSKTPRPCQQVIAGPLCFLFCFVLLCFFFYIKNENCYLHFISFSMFSV